MIFYFVSASINTANTLFAEVGIGFSIAAIVIILALTTNTLLDEVSKKREKARPSPLGVGGGWNVHESKAQPGNDTENPPLGTVKENCGFFSAKPWLIGELRRRNGPRDEGNGAV
jgi:hypothetical protein